MNLLDTIREEKDKKMIGKRFILNYNDIIPSYHSLAQDEVIDYTIVEYLGKGIYKDLLTQNIIAENANYDIVETIDFQLNLYEINRYLKIVTKNQSEKILESISNEQIEKIKQILLEARINTLKNAKEQLEANENKVKSLQK